MQSYSDTGVVHIIAISGLHLALIYQILQLLLQGFPNKVIARSLGISPNTVKVHVHAIFRELRVRSRMDLAITYLPASYLPLMVQPSATSVNDQKSDQPIFRFGMHTE